MPHPFEKFHPIPEAVDHWHFPPRRGAPFLEDPDSWAKLSKDKWKANNPLTGESYVAYGKHNPARRNHGREKSV